MSLVSFMKIKSFSKYIYLMSILLVIAFLYQRYSTKLDNEKNSQNYDSIQKFLLNDPDDLENGKIKKPILWIHLAHEYNARSWMSFGSRSSFELNQPYLYLTVSSIIKMCDKSFHICLIEDSSFEKLINDWSIDLSRVSNPSKDYIRHLGMCKLLHKYGGMVVPVSFDCMRDLKDLYEHGTVNDKLFVCEMNNRNITSTHKNFYPSINFMGCHKNIHIMEEYIEFLQRTISGDFTDQMKFLGEMDRWMNTKIEKKQVNLIDGKLIGTKTMEEDPILIEDLLSYDYIDIYPQTYGIYIPADEILNRRHYEWFARMSPRQVLESNLCISKYLLLSNTPDAKMGVIEPMEHEKPDWIGFWKVPSGAPNWGPKPIYLGNRVPKLEHPNN